MLVAHLIEKIIFTHFTVNIYEYLSLISSEEKIGFIIFIFPKTNRIFMDIALLVQNYIRTQLDFTSDK